MTTPQPAAPRRRLRLTPFEIALATTLGVLLTILVIAVALLGMPEFHGGQGGGTSGSASGDVQVSSCELAVGGQPTAHLQVTNHTSAAADYLITVVFESASNVQLGSSLATVLDLGPGQLATTDASGFGISPQAGEIHCRVSTVRRT